VVKGPVDPAKAAAIKKRNTILMIALLVVFAASFTKNVLFYKPLAVREREALIKSGAVDAQPSDQPAADSGTTLSDQLVYVTNLRQFDKLRDEQRKVWEKEWSRDPFVLQETTSRLVKAVNLTLKGVLWDEAAPKAIVNEKTLTVGDTIYGYTVTDIRPQSVILTTGEKSVELRVFGLIAVDSA
jgi:hypothetical protein